MSVANTTYSMMSDHLITPAQMYRAASNVSNFIDTNHYSYYCQQNGFSGNPYTNSLLNDLNNCQKQHRDIDDRAAKEEKTYCEVEYALMQKCDRYTKRFERKITNLMQQYPSAATTDVVETIDKIVDLESRITDMKGVIHAKRWYEDRNQFYRKLVEQKMLRENIDGLTQKIRYFEQLVLNHVHKMRQDGQSLATLHTSKVTQSIVSRAQSDEDNVVSIVTPFVVKEALRIKAENEQELNGLRERLDEIRQNRH